MVVENGTMLELNPSDLPVTFYYKEKIYYVKYTKNKDSLYMNCVELDKEQPITNLVDSLILLRCLEIMGHP